MLEGRSRAHELCGGRVRIIHAEGEPDDAGHASPDLDPVERLGLPRVEQLERGATRVEDQATAVRPVPRLDLGEPQRIAIERDRAIEVIDGEGDPDLVNLHEPDLTQRPPARHTGRMTTTTETPLASWGDFASADHELAGAGARHLDRANGAALLATVRGDLAPRLHPVTVGVVDDGLFVFLLDSAKRRDLIEDGRYALHAHQDMAAPDEFSIRGRAALVPPGEVRERVADGWFFEVDDTYWLFELRIATAIIGERGANEWPPRYTRWSGRGRGR